MRVPVAIAIAACACGGEETVADPYACIAGGGAGCFELPTAALAAADASGREVPPVLDCALHAVIASVGPVALSGTTVDPLAGGAAVPGARVELFSDLPLEKSLGDATADAAGAYAMTIDALPSEVFARMTAEAYLPTHALHRRLDVSQAQLDADFELSTRAAHDARLVAAGDRFRAGTSQLFGHALDCAGNRLIHAIVNIAPASGATGSRLYVPGVRVYYAGTTDPLALERRTERSETSTSGAFAATSLGPGRSFVQVWGFPTAMDVAREFLGLTMLGEREVFAPEGEAALIVPVYGRVAR